ncbi:MAG: hypothetical protein WC483_00585 [Candidatus Paceibacterota bacterium]
MRVADAVFPDSPHSAPPSVSTRKKYFCRASSSREESASRHEESTSRHVVA